MTEGENITYPYGSFTPAEYELFLTLVEKNTTTEPLVADEYDAEIRLVPDRESLMERLTELAYP